MNFLVKTSIFHENIVKSIVLHFSKNIARNSYDSFSQAEIEEIMSTWVISVSSCLMQINVTIVICYAATFSKPLLSLFPYSYIIYHRRRTFICTKSPKRGHWQSCNIHIQMQKKYDNAWQEVETACTFVRKKSFKHVNALGRSDRYQILVWH